MIAVSIFLSLLVIIVVSVWAYKLWTMFENIEEIKKTICDNKNNNNTI